ncbi:hypothetical protein [Nocardioides sp.]|uniref:hypothetical protein n=1 Tax=Nocardioides sp. TaxID=35761 RepID=UPI00271D39A8|nr:hypothetical protein [Nocardioides sp.]MDO9454997.1 hypothetical protein [Nocardioides sp.]
MTGEMYLPAFFVKQKFAMTTNRYEVWAANPDGSFGDLMAVAQQKRLAFKEEVTFYSDESQSRAVFSFKARKKIDLNAGYDVFDENRQTLGFFRKDFGKSLLRSTFHLEGPGYQGVGQERSQAVAVVRRFMDIPFLPIHFDFTGPGGGTILQVERQSSVRDKYTVTVPERAVDFRVAAAVAVGLDALMQR